MNDDSLLIRAAALAACGTSLVLTCGVAARLVARHPLDRRRIASWSLFAAALLPLAAALPPRATVAWRLLPVDRPATQQASIPEPPRLVVDHRGQPELHAESPTVQARPIAGVEPRAPGFRWSGPLAIAAAYFAGLTAVLTRMGLGFFAVRHYVRRGTQPGDELHTAWRELAGPWAERATLLVDVRAASPCIVWWGRPYLLMPAHLASDPRGARFALAHELAHLRHGDLPRWMATNLACAVLWFHPLAWWTRRDVRDAQDQLADAQAAGHAPAEYAEFLVRAARSLLGRAPVAGLAMASRPSALARRVHWLLNGARPRPMGRFALTTFALALGVLPTAASVLRLEAALPPPPPPVSDPPHPAAPVQAFTVEVLDALTGQPLPGAKVTRIKVEHGRQQSIADLGACDARGRFTVQPPTDASTVELSVRHPGYLEQTLWWSPTFAWQSKMVYLLPAATLTGRLIQQGHGLAGARVAAVSGDWDDWDRSFVGVVTTDDAGRFQVKVAREQPTSLQVTSPASGPLEFTFERPVADVGDLQIEPGVQVGGMVTTSSGVPAAGVTVRAYPRFGVVQQQVVASFRDLPSVKTDDAGKFAFPALQGEYAIDVADEDSNLERGIFRIQTVIARADTPLVQLKADPAVELEVIVRFAQGGGIQNVRASQLLVEYVNPDSEFDKRVTVLQSDTTSDAAGRMLLPVPARLSATDRITLLLDFDQAGLPADADIHYVAKIDGKVVDESDARIPERRTRLRIELPPNQ